MKNILLIGGSTGIGYELSKKLVDNNNVFISTRNTEIFNGTEIKSHVLNLDEEFELDWLPDQLDGFVYLPGTINLRPFKGIKPSTFMDDFNINSSNVFVLSGPNLSKELHNKELTGTVIAGEDSEFIESLCNAFKTKYFIPFTNNDRYGVELGGALKNIYAILSGYFHKKGVGENTIGLLLTKCLSEMSEYSKARGANPSTFLGLAGVGDFFSTALSHDSRNYKFGEFLAQNKSPEEALELVGDTVEGYATSLSVSRNAKDLGVNLKLLNYLISIYEENNAINFF